MSISVIVPTIARPSLSTTLSSIVTAGIEHEDEVVIACDGPGYDVLPAVYDSGLSSACTVRLVTLDQHRGRWGAYARNAALETATGDWIAYIDDDDVYLPAALDDVRTVLAYCDPTKPELHIFRADMRGDHRVTPGQDGCLWIDRELRVGNVSSCMLVHSLAPLEGVRWRTDVYEHDYHFAADLVAAGYEVFWEEAVVAAVRPHGPQTT